MGAVLTSSCCSRCLPSASVFLERGDRARGLHRSSGSDAQIVDVQKDQTKCAKAGHSLLHVFHDGQNVLVECPDCRGEVPANDFHDHRVNRCQHRMITCPDCLKLLLIKDLDEHQARECDHHCRKQLSVEMEHYLAKFVDCPDCRKRVLATDFNEHRSNECEHRMVTCPECSHVVLSLHLDEHRRNQCDQHLKKLLLVGEAHRLATLVDCIYCRKRIPGTEIHNHMTNECHHRKVECVDCGWKVYAKHMDEHKRTECDHHARGAPQLGRRGLHTRRSPAKGARREQTGNGNQVLSTEQMMTRAAALDEEQSASRRGALETTMVARHLSAPEAQKLVDRLGGGGARDRRPRAIYLGAAGAAGALTRVRARSPGATSPLRAASPSPPWSPSSGTSGVAQGTSTVPRARSPAQNLALPRTNPVSLASSTRRKLVFASGTR